jgi:predicted transcriptional regulator of viral defense system
MKEHQTPEAPLSLGRLESQILAVAGRLEKPGITLQEALSLNPDLSRRSVHQAFQRLEKKVQLRRIARGRYFLPGQEPSLVGCHAFPPSYVSFLTVLHDAGFTEQIPRRVDFAYARSHLRRASWGGLPLVWHPIPPAAFTGYQARENGVLEATAAKAAADLIHRQKDFGGVTPFREMIVKALRKSKPSPFEEAAAAYADRPATLRRILYLRYEHERVPPALRRLLHETDLHNPLPLDALRPSKVKPKGDFLNIRDEGTA